MSKKVEVTRNNKEDDKAEIFGCKSRLLPFCCFFVYRINSSLKVFFHELILLIMKKQNTILASVCDAFHFYFDL